MISSIAQVAAAAPLDAIPREASPDIPTGAAARRQTAAQVSRTELLLGFLYLGLVGFGGITPWARHLMVEKRRWLTDREFATFLGVGQVLPGPQTSNACIMIGNHFQGAAGAAIAAAGLLAAPLVILVLLAVLYEQFAALPDVNAALAGASAAVAGMFIGNGVKMVRNIRPGAPALALMLVTFAAVALFSLPLLLVFAAVLPLSLAATLIEKRQ